MIDHFSGTLALFAFSVVIIIGLLSGSDFHDILIRSLAGMFMFLIIGKILGFIGVKMIKESVESKKTERDDGKKPEATPEK